MSWQAAVLERIGQIERETIAEVEQLVQSESTRLTTSIDTERTYLRSAVRDSAREIVLCGELAAAKVVHKGLVLADQYRAKDPARAARAEWVAMGIHDQIVAAAQSLADRVLAYEQSLGAPLQRSKREALNDALPGLKRVVEDAAHRTAVEQRRSLPKRREAPTAEIEAWRKQLVDALRSTRTAAKERVDIAHKRARNEVERLTAELNGLPGPIRKRLNDLAENRAEGWIKQGSEGRPHPRPGFVRTVLGWLGAVLIVFFVFFLGTSAMSAGIGFAVAAVGALALQGYDAPLVMGGLLMGVVGCTIGALLTDFLFGSLGDWWTSLEDSLLGAIVPNRERGKAQPVRELAQALQYVELPPLSPDRVTTPAASGAVRVALKSAQADLLKDQEEITGRIRIPRKPGAP